MGLSDCIHGDFAVILLDADCSEGLTLKSVLQAVGVQVYVGPHTAEAETMPLIVVHAWNRNQPDIARRIEMARQVFPAAPVCFVTGKAVPAAVWPMYDDARTALDAVGVGFVCGEFVALSTEAFSARR